MAFPGKHPSFKMDEYGPDERKIIFRFAKDWFVTTGFSQIKLAEKSVYRAFLMKACEPIEQMFNLEREIMVLFSAYEEFEVRTLDGFDAIGAELSTLRADPICRVLISKDPNIVERIKDLLKDDPELPVIIPFTYNELVNSTDNDLIVNRFRNHFFSRDLFAFESPLKRDTYFFGRSGLINNILARHRSNENSALFGLRRSGKTSIVFGLERACRASGQSFISIDCQSPSVHKRRWNELLPYILRQIIFKYSLPKDIINEDYYNELNASDQFYEDVKKIYLKLQKSSILIAFDEIERISPKIGSSEHWAEGTDFILLWQSIRSAFQRHTSVFSFCLLGTNPLSIETAKINGQDNPIFNGVPISYIPGFNIEQTTEMLKKLGTYMGLRFDDTVCAKMQEDFGGHPYLMRHVSSIMHNSLNIRRPVIIDKSVYEKSKEEFTLKYSNYTDMILDVLIVDFPDEYILLNALATGDKDLFDTYAADVSIISHLMGYGLLSKGLNDFYFKIDSIRQHLKSKSQYKKLNLQPNEMMQEVAARRALLEPAMRSLISLIYKANFGMKAKDEALKLVFGQARDRLVSKSFSECLKANAIDLNFSDLAKLILGNWNLFKNIFSMKQSDFEFYFEAIRKVRTEEAHSGEITEVEFAQARIAFDAIEAQMKAADYLGG